MLLPPSFLFGPFFFVGPALADLWLDGETKFDAYA